MASSDIFSRTKSASLSLAALDDTRRNTLLLRVADTICEESGALLEANAKDLAAMDRSNPLYDRLQLTEERLKGIAGDMRQVASLPSPLDRTLVSRTLPNGLKLRKVSVPFGVIGVIYEDNKFWNEEIEKPSMSEEKKQEVENTIDLYEFGFEYEEHFI